MQSQPLRARSEEGAERFIGRLDPFIYLHVLPKFCKQLQIWRTFYRKCSSPVLKNVLHEKRRCSYLCAFSFFYAAPSRLSSYSLPCCLQCKGRHHNKRYRSTCRSWLHAEQRGKCWASSRIEQHILTTFPTCFLLGLCNWGTQGYILHLFGSTPNAATSIGVFGNGNLFFGNP